MRSFTAFMLLFLMTTISFAQVQFEKGYIITKDNKRINCLIKNMSWKDNPVEFTYKLEKSDRPKKGDINSIKEFGIDNHSKYVNANVRIDPSNKPGPGLKNKLDPVWTRDTLFLKVLLEGEASLYGYNKGKVVRYFYSAADSVINPLIYKEIHEGNTIIKNNDFRQQLWDKLKIPGSSFESLKTVEYTERDLKNYFKTYNGKFNKPVTEIIPPAKKKLINLKVTPGLTFSSGSFSYIKSDGTKADLTFDSKPGIRLGLEAELALPLHQYRWGILFEPNFQSYNSDAVDGTETASISYKSVELPVGLRYYMPLGNNSRVYVNGFFVSGAAMNLDSEIEYTHTPSDVQFHRTAKIETASNWAFGAGLDHRKFSVEARYSTNRNILKNDNFLFSDVNRISLVLGYKFMSKKL
ncbi:MAG TPA: outer membrane beta-barrel protein [Prolixibacteraceae bacterium]|nr:outer membrane beta-barrel protein [Prolixibacteraceae bacterium]